jgi:hypothetical protein
MENKNPKKGSLHFVAGFLLIPVDITANLCVYRLFNYSLTVVYNLAICWKSNFDIGKNSRFAVIKNCQFLRMILHETSNHRNYRPVFIFSLPQHQQWLVPHP